MHQPAVFFDRDGTLNAEVCYLSSPEQFQLIGQAADAIRELKLAGFRVVVFTNQAGIARGYFTEQQLAAVHDHMRRVLAQSGASLDGVYYCPHHPEHGIGPWKTHCECRKPKPGMLRQAASELQIDLAQSFVVGDKVLDLEAGHAVGARTVLVRTGYGQQSECTLPEHPSVQPEFIADDAWQAAQWILNRR
jgi:D-glycero-D-manno-heptose 1,7-bisphosphate phosphatase